VDVIEVESWLANSEVVVVEASVATVVVRVAVVLLDTVVEVELETSVAIWEVPANTEAIKLGLVVGFFNGDEEGKGDGGKCTSLGFIDGLVANVLAGIPP